MAENLPKRTIVAFEISAPIERVDVTAGGDSQPRFLNVQSGLRVTFSAEIEGHPNGLFQSEPIRLSMKAREKIQTLLEQLIAEETKQ